MGGGEGKLRAAARWLLTAEDGGALELDHEAEAQLRSIGVSEQQIQQQRRQRALARGPEPEGPALWAWHQVPWAVFVAMRRQWRTAATMAGVLWIGLDLAVLPVVEQRLGLPPLTAEELRALDVLAAEAAAVMNGPA